MYVSLRGKHPLFAPGLCFVREVNHGFDSSVPDRGSFARHR